MRACRAWLFDRALHEFVSAEQRNRLPAVLLYTLFEWPYAVYVIQDDGEQYVIGSPSAACAVRLALERMPGRECTWDIGASSDAATAAALGVIAAAGGAVQGCGRA